MVAEEVLAGANFGILICGSGNGVSMAANKHKGIRAALCWSEEITKLARQHNDANIISIPARFMSLETSTQIIKTFLTEPFEGGRHQKSSKNLTHEKIYLYFLIFFLPQIPFHKTAMLIALFNQCSIVAKLK